MIAINLRTERLLLNNVEEKDCNDTYLSWLNDRETNQYLESGFYTHSIESIKEFVETQNKTALFAAIRLKNSTKHIGNIKIAKINTFHKTGEYGIMMGDKSEWGKGYAKEASIAIINYCFHEMDLRKIVLGVIDLNTTAHRLYRNLGFVEEGVLKENFFYTGDHSYRDEIRMAVFKKDWTYQ